MTASSIIVFVIRRTHRFYLFVIILVALNSFDPMIYFSFQN